MPIEPAVLCVLSDHPKLRLGMRKPAMLAKLARGNIMTHLGLPVGWKFALAGPTIYHGSTEGPLTAGKLQRRKGGLGVREGLAE